MGHTLCVIDREAGGAAARRRRNRAPAPVHHAGLSGLNPPAGGASTAQACRFPLRSDYGSAEKCRTAVLTRPWERVVVATAIGQKGGGMTGKVIVLALIASGFTAAASVAQRRAAARPPRG